MTLNEPLVNHFPRLTERQKKALERVGLVSVRDLLFYFPSRYEAFSERKNIIDLAEGDKTTVYGKVIDLKTAKTWRKKLNISSATLGDMTGTIDAVWFHQPYIAKMLKVGDKVALTGKVTKNKSGLYIANPTYEKINSYEALGEGGAILPVYPETKGVTSRWLRFALSRILPLALSKSNIHDHLPESILKKYHLPDIKSALIYIHKPQKLRDAEAARKRFAFEEVFFIQLARQRERNILASKKSFNLDIDRNELKEFISIFPFSLTSAQNKAIERAAKDMSSDRPMSRLLEGDVGSGKTAVAVCAAYMATSNGYQVAYMAPTEILAAQHFQSFVEYFSELRLTTKIALITSSGCKKYPSKVLSAGWRNEKTTHIAKPQLLKWVGNGEIPIIIGTHALIQKSVAFKNLALVIIDEQHRFGVKQRSALVKKNTDTVPHLLSMTATPIPRTLALTIYSDLDLSLLDEMPPDRPKVITEVVPPEKRAEAYSKIEKELEEGRQAFVVCPRIAPTLGEVGVPTSPIESLGSVGKAKSSEQLEVKNVKDEAARLKKEVFKDKTIEILHGKMTAKEKEGTLKNFHDKKIDILVATSVIEVGINVPNATVIIIEGAERFGLAQLHQLRGRVIRSSHQPYAYIFTDSGSAATLERLRALTKAKNGFELAEYDLKFRGPGELSGMKQWGISDIGMEALKNLKMVEAARAESRAVLEKDPGLKNHPLLLEIIERRHKEAHFE